MKMHRKKLVTIILVGSLVLTSLLAGCGSGDAKQEAESQKNTSQETITLVLANSQQTGSAVAMGIDRFAELVKEKSNGTIIIDVHHDAELGSDVETTQQVQAGSLDMGTTSNDNFGVFDEDVLALSLPYAIDRKNLDKLYDAIDNGELGEYYKKRMADINLHPLMFNEYGFRCYMSASAPIVLPSDMKNMKLRATSSQVELAAAEALGAPAQTVSWGETYMALQQGTVDGESNTFNALHAAKHDEVLKYAATTEHNYSMHILLMAEDKYQSLTDEQKAVLDEAAAEAVVYQREILKQQEEAAKEAFREKGIEIVELTDEQKVEWKNAMSGVYGKLVPSIISQDVIDLLKAIEE